MSERTAGVAFDTMLAAGFTNDDLGWESLALLEALDFEYERWCRVIGVDPDDESVFDAYRTLHTKYVDVWKEVGTQEFVNRIGDRVAKWQRILATKL